jgi:hypothetical protein
LTDVDSIFARHWGELDMDDGSLPRFVRNIQEVDYQEFREKIDTENQQFIQEIVDNLYQGDAYLIRGAFSKKFTDGVKAKTKAWCQQRPESFHRMLEGTPDFHRRITEDLAHKYSIKHIKQATYFFPWNDDPLDLFDTIRERWRLIKYLSGLERTSFENNTPIDGVVDRIQIARYPEGAGYIEPHTDPHTHQRFIISGFLSKRGRDFDSGGFYAYRAENDVVDIEASVEIGDMCINFATIEHGVEVIDEGVATDWESYRGRWFLGLYSNVSDHVKDRATSSSVEK